MAIRPVRVTPTSTPRTTPHVQKSSRASTVAKRVLNKPQTPPQPSTRAMTAPRTAAQIANSRAPKKGITTVAASTTPTLAKKTLTKGPSLIGRITKPKNLLLIGAASGAIAAKAAFISLAMKIGPTAAGHVFAQEIMLFLAPGATALAFGLELALKTATSMFVNGALPIILPILSTVVVTTLVVGLATYLAYLLLLAMKNRIYAFGERVGAALDKTMIGRAVKATALAVISAFSPIEEKAKEKKVEKTEPSPSMVSCLTSLVVGPSEGKPTGFGVRKIRSRPAQLRFNEADDMMTRVTNKALKTMKRSSAQRNQEEAERAQAKASEILISAYSMPYGYEFAGDVDVDSDDESEAPSKVIKDPAPQLELAKAANEKDIFAFNLARIHA